MQEYHTHRWRCFISLTTKLCFQKVYIPWYKWDRNGKKSWIVEDAVFSLNVIDFVVRMHTVSCLFTAKRSKLQSTCRSWKEIPLADMPLAVPQIREIPCWTWWGRLIHCSWHLGQSVHRSHEALSKDLSDITRYFKDSRNSCGHLS